MQHNKEELSTQNGIAVSHVGAYLFVKYLSLIQKHFKQKWLRSINERKY